MRTMSILLLAALTAAPAFADEAAARRWIDQEFQPSTLSKEQQLAELKWFMGAAAQLKAQGIDEISVVSETITTHEYEAKTLAPQELEMWLDRHLRIHGFSWLDKLHRQAAAPCWRSPRVQPVRSCHPHAGS